MLLFNLTHCALVHPDQWYKLDATFAVLFGWTTGWTQVLVFLDITVMMSHAHVIEMKRNDIIRHVSRTRLMMELAFFMWLLTSTMRPYECHNTRDVRFHKGIFLDVKHLRETRSHKSRSRKLLRSRDVPLVCTEKCYQRL